ncbi:MAG: hypothetical protein ACKPA7_09820, partial [Sphaerospermopsis kisseleviana]
TPSTPKVSIQEIDKRIDARISTAIQDIDKRIDARISTASIQEIDKRIDARISTASLQEIDKRIDARISTASIQDIDNAVRQLIADSLEDGIIGEAINKAYGAMMGQFNAVLEEMHVLQSQFAKLTNSPAMGNRTAELEIPHNKQQIIRAALRKQQIKVSSEQIRKAFKLAGWNGNNFETIRNDILEILRH